MRFSLEVNPRLARRPALDGLRGLAVIAVILFHSCLQPLFPGGLLGVDVFFVLSGFLITTLLLQEWAARGDIALRSFYVRRALRLLPALLLVVAVYAAVVAVTRGAGPDTALRAVAALTYWFNWLVVYNVLPNDELGPVWSLAIEEQFYLVWPGLLLLMLRRWSPLTILGITVAVIATSAALPLFHDMPGNRMYFRTEFRLHELMTGALLAQLYVAGVVRRETVQAPAFKLLLAIAVAALIWFLFMFGSPSAFLRDGGHLLVALCAAVAVLACVFVEGGRLAGITCNRALVYTGSRSYALYLWHLPLSAWLPLVIPMHPLLWFLGWAVLAFIAAELSHRLVEGPALRLKDRLCRLAAPEPVTTAEPRSAYVLVPRSRWLPGVSGASAFD